MFNKKKKKSIQQLESLLDQAISGCVVDVVYDESDYSRISFKMSKFLQQMQMSQEWLTDQKESIHQLISDMSHQTKTPIANIQLYTELLTEQLGKRLKEDDSGRDSIVFMLSELDKQTEKLSFLMDTMARASRLEVGLIAIKPKLQFIEPLLTSVVKELEPLAQEKGVELILHKTGFESNQVEIPYDKKWLAEALHNIVENGIKYGGQKVIVSLEIYEMFIRINVKDFGLGIRETEVGQIFGRFYRSADVHEQEGLGIGLYLAREIVERHKGYIKVDSELEAGSLFSIFVPKTCL